MRSALAHAGAKRSASTVANTLRGADEKRPSLIKERGRAGGARFANHAIFAATDHNIAR